MPIQTPKLTLPKISPTDAMWICIGIYAAICLYLSVSEWQRNKMFKVTQDRLTMAYETQIYQAYRERSNGPVHDRVAPEPPVDDHAGSDESLPEPDGSSAESNGYVPYCVGGARSLANVDEEPEELEADHG